jgi:glycosyltransferase involved in cell wall biosynthesis
MIREECRFVLRIPPISEPLGGVNFLVACAGLLAQWHKVVLVLSNRLEEGFINAPDPRIQLCFSLPELRAGDVVISTDAHPPSEVMELGRRRPAITNVVAVQNHYYFARFLPQAGNPALGIDRFIATSQAIGSFLGTYFADIPVSRVPCFVAKAFRLPKEKLISLMSRKRRAEARLIVSFFRYRFPQYAHWRFHDIHGVGHDEALAALARSRIFISLQAFEGFGLPALEAMAAACAVVGFTGGGADEYASAQNGIWAEQGNWERVPDDLAILIADTEAGGSRISTLAAEGENTARRYQLAATSSALADFAALVMQDGC